MGDTISEIMALEIGQFLSSNGKACPSGSDLHQDQPDEGLRGRQLLRSFHTHIALIA